MRRGAGLQRYDSGLRRGAKLIPTKRGRKVSRFDVPSDASVEDGLSLNLLQHTREVERLRHYVCPQCGTPVGNREVAMKRLKVAFASASPCVHQR